MNQVKFLADTALRQTILALLLHVSFHPNSLVFHQKPQNQGRVQQQET